MKEYYERLFRLLAFGLFMSIASCNQTAATPSTAISPTALVSAMVTPALISSTDTPMPVTATPVPPTQTPLPSYMTIQEGNTLPRILLKAKPWSELADSRIGSHWHSLWADYPPMPWLAEETEYLGVKRFRVFINEGDWDGVDWSRDEFVIDPVHEQFIDRLAENGVIITYNLIFWDKATYPGGAGAPCHRFKTEEEIAHYLEFVRFTVDHFKGKVQQYEIWNEPDNNNCPQYIEPQDYINLVRDVVPVIHQEDPEAKIVVGANVLPDPNARTYLFTILESDIMPLVDLISWHAFYGHSPECDPDYYYGYPILVGQIKEEALANGFEGKFEVDELNWRPITEPAVAWCQNYGEIAYAKYWTRGVLMNLGLDVIAGNLRNHPGWPASYEMVHNLTTVMEGNETNHISMTVQSEASKVTFYSFSLPSGDDLIAVWNDDVAVDYDDGIASAFIVRDHSGWKAIGIDVLNGFEQELVSSNEGADLVIENFLLKDFPILIRLSK